MHCGDLNGKQVQKGGDICVYISDSFFCTVETNNFVSFYTPIKINFKKSKKKKKKKIKNL